MTTPLASTRPPPTIDRELGWRLVAAAQQGDMDAYGQLWSMYAPKVRDTARYLWFQRTGHNSPQVAQDVTAETFTRALRMLHTVAPSQSDVTAWLYRIARNIVADMAKSSPHRREFVADVDRMAAAWWAAPDDTAGEVVAAELSRIVRATVAALESPGQRQVIELRYLQGLSPAEVAGITGLTVGAVKSMQHRAERNLALALVGVR